MIVAPASIANRHCMAKLSESVWLRNKRQCSGFIDQTLLDDLGAVARVAFTQLSTYHDSFTNPEHLTTEDLHFDDHGEFFSQFKISLQIEKNTSAADVAGEAFAGISFYCK